MSGVRPEPGREVVVDPMGAPRLVTGHVPVVTVAGAPGAPLALPPAATIDVAELPDMAFGSRGHMWWGSLLMSIIEGGTLAICIFSYFYVRRNFDAWPPARIAQPNIVVGTGSLLVFLLSLIPARWVKRTARDMSLRGVQISQAVLTIFVLATVLMRGFEFGHLNVRWDETAYGSVVWATMVFHTAVLLGDVGEMLAMTLVAFRGPWHTRHFGDAEDGTLYWGFTALAWVPLYVMLYLYPRWA